MPTNLSAVEALTRLKEGNSRFVGGTVGHPRQNQTRRSELTGGQSPFAIVLSCADSRVSPELMFDEGLGDLFVIRVAGNVAEDEVLGSIEYAVAHLNVKLIVVMGHESCGAVSASMGDALPGGHIDSLVHRIKPAVERAKALEGDAVENAVKTNARMVAEQVASADPFIATKVNDQDVQVIPAYYRLSDGGVEFLS